MVTLRMKAKLLKKLGLWHCYECGRITRPHWMRVFEDADGYGIRAPFCKMHIDRKNDEMYNYVNTEPMTREEAVQDHIYGNTL